MSGTSSTYCVRAGRPESTITWSARKIDSRRSWVMSTPVKGSFSFTLCMVCHRSSRVKASSAPKGSSRISTSGLCTSARQSEARWRMPPESSEGRLSSKPVSPTSESRWRARSSCSFLDSLFGTISSGRITFCRIVRHSSRTGFWKAMPTVERGPFTGSPCSQTSPWSGFINPAISRVRVDLPQPDGPTTAQNPPSGTETFRPSSTGKGPFCVW
ncbi:hypothetical protein SSE37_12364 [Sagittula stellata E-37]|uniref:Uncharacterized protein n=1 Tax=Sagittula stellata (strain ATCC 700073 / DSM 11524 / E-37) TaxID=388399 RepID=A3K475_SAGS3|nr:hypothetical protein SSE37_12364 [Sagittula stellata E-37]